MPIGPNQDGIVYREWSFFPNFSGGFKAILAGTVNAHRLVTATTTAVGALPQVVQSALGDATVMGLLNRNYSGAAGEMVQIVRGGSGLAVADDAITVGRPLKCGYQGRVVQFIDATLTGSTILAATAGGNASNDSAINDIVQVVSSNAGDTTQTVTLIGTTNGTTTVVVQNVALNGTTAVDSAKSDWGSVLAVKLSASCAGTVTIRKKTGPATITTITTTNLSAGVNSIAAGAGAQAYYQKPTVVASGASTAQVGYAGTDSTGATVYDAVALNGTTAATFATTSPKRVIETYYLAPASSVNVTMSVGALDNQNLYIGQAEGQAAVQGDLIAIYSNPI